MRRAVTGAAMACMRRKPARGCIVRGKRGAESSGVLLCRLINARESVRAVRTALHGARAAGAGEACRRLRAARASLGGVVRHLERLHGEACAREFRDRQAAARSVARAELLADYRSPFVAAVREDAREGVRRNRGGVK